MRTLIISDIHGNWPALRAIAETRFDAVISLGDLVGYGPFPSECVEWVQKNALISMQGNHDRAYGENVPARCRPQFRWLSDAVAPLTWRNLDTEKLKYLAALPRWAVLDIEGRKHAFLHATPKDPLYEYMGPDPKQWAAELGGLDVEVLVVGHTHLQFALSVGKVEVVNPGSVGQPKDGDPRAAFLLIENGVWKLERVAYDVEETVSALYADKVDMDAATVLSTLLRTGTVPPTATTKAPDSANG
ncbi:MAG: metallophosphoesterase family protein [Gemmatimonadaceae bacterium]